MGPLSEQDRVPFFFRGEQATADAESDAAWEAKKETILRSLARRGLPEEELGWLFVYTRRNDEHFLRSGPLEMVKVADEYTARHLFFEARSGCVNLPGEDKPVPVHFFAIARIVDGWDCALKEQSWMNPRRSWGVGGIRLCRVCDTYHATHEERSMCPEVARQEGKAFDKTFAEVRRWREQRKREADAQ